MIQQRSVKLLASIVAAACLVFVPVLQGAMTDRAGAVSDPPVDVSHRRSQMSLDLVSRSYSGGVWTIVVDARLSSNNVCVIAVFDCIVGALNIPAGATLVDLQCRSPFWNHLIVFRNHCLKQILTAGHHQKFRFTYTTTQQSGTVTLGAEFGRGLLPWIFQQLATATVTVNLDDPLTVSKVCDPTIVQSGATFTCTLEVAYPMPVGGSGASITAATLNDVPAAGLFTGNLTTSGPWTCITSLCTLTGSINPGDTTTFTYTGTAASTVTGGTGPNGAALAWTAPSSGSASASEEITVVGSGDTNLSITKAATGASVPVGQPLTWSVTVTNPGNGANIVATGVTVTDAASLVSAGSVLPQTVTLQYASGVGTWACSVGTCTSAAMPVGSTTFVASTTPAQSGTIVNESSVAWTNDILGPTAAEVAGASAIASPVATTTTTSVPTTSAPTRSPSRLSFTG